MKHKRASLMSLRIRPVGLLEDFVNSYLTIDEILESCMRRYNTLFGRLRPRGSPSVPSDDLRRRLVVGQFIMLVQKRRWCLERLAKVTGGPTPIWLIN